MKLIGKLKTLTSDKIEKSAVSIGFECLDRELFDPEKCYDKLAATGVKYARCQTGWIRCEKQKGVYTFEWLDSVVDNLLSRGIQPWLDVSFGCPVYMDDMPNETAVGCVPIYYGEECLEAWKNFVREIAKRYKNKVTYYEIWNECDIKCFWYPSDPNGTELARFVSLTGEVIKSVNPDAKVGTCTSHSDPKFIRALFEGLRPDELDFYNYHSYAKIPEKQMNERVPAIRWLLDNTGHENCELLNGECGHASWYPDNHHLKPKDGNSSEHQQAVWILRRYMADRMIGIKATSLFQTVDMWQKVYKTATYEAKRPAADGILRGITYEPKLSYYAYSNLCTLLTGELENTNGLFTIDIGNPHTQSEYTLEVMAIQKFILNRDNRPMYIYWLPSDIEKEKDGYFTAEATARLGRFGVVNPISDPAVIDPLTGRIYKPEKVENDGFEVVIKDLPIAEYPMIVCDSDMFEAE